MIPSVRGVFAIVLALAIGRLRRLRAAQAAPPAAGHQLPGHLGFDLGQARAAPETASESHGSFTGYREGGLTGELDGDVWHFIWDQKPPHSHGHGFMQLTPDGQHLEGRWGYMKDDIDGGRWAADKRKRRARSDGTTAATRQSIR